MLDKSRAEIPHAVGSPHENKRRIFFFFQPTRQRNVRVGLLKHGGKSDDFRAQGKNPPSRLLDIYFRVLLPAGDLLQPVGSRHLHLRGGRASPRNTPVFHPVHILGKGAQCFSSVRRAGKHNLAHQKITSRQSNEMIKLQPLPIGIEKMLILNHALYACPCQA